MKELLRKAFEAGKDKQWDIEWQMGRSKPDFEQWYKEHEIQALNIPVVVGRSEQLKCDCCDGTGMVEGEHYDDLQSCNTCLGKGTF